VFSEEKIHLELTQPGLIFTCLANAAMPLPDDGVLRQGFSATVPPKEPYKIDWECPNMESFAEA